MSNQEAKAEMDGYLRSLTHTNPSLELDKEKVILYTRHIDAPPRVSIIIASVPPWGARLASLVGPGLASAYVCIDGDGSFNCVDSLSRAVQHRVDATRGVLVLSPGSDDAWEDMEHWVDAVKTHNPQVDIETFTGPYDKCIEGGGFYLLAKICGALAAACWPLASVMTVARLVNRNLLFVGRTEKQERPDWHVPTLVQGALRGLLHHEQRNPSFVHVNSNEVVLSITLSPMSARYERGHIVDAMVSQLRDDWNIRPVRVFTNIHWRSNTFAEEDRHFSITLLNVCNTDIGGPSMIQLLDAPCEAEGWKAFAQKESWESHRQLETTRTEAHAEPSTQESANVAMATPEEAEDRPEVPAAHDSMPAPPEAASGAPNQSTTSSQYIAALPISALESTDVGNLPAVDEAPTPAEQAQEHRESIVDALQIKEADFNTAIESIRQREPVPRPIRQLDDSSLIDMVRQQVQALGVSAEVESKPESGAVGDLDKPEADKRDSDEEYEMV